MCRVGALRSEECICPVQVRVSCLQASGHPDGPAEVTCPRERTGGSTPSPVTGRPHEPDASLSPETSDQGSSGSTHGLSGPVDRAPRLPSEVDPPRVSPCKGSLSPSSGTLRYRDPWPPRDDRESPVGVGSPQSQRDQSGTGASGPPRGVSPARAPEPTRSKQKRPVETQSSSSFRDFRSLPLSNNGPEVVGQGSPAGKERPGRGGTRRGSRVRSVPDGGWAEGVAGVGRRGPDDRTGHEW